MLDERNPPAARAAMREAAGLEKRPGPSGSVEKGAILRSSSLIWTHQTHSSRLGCHLFRQEQYLR